MFELRKLLKAREKLVAQREWAIAGEKFYANVHLTAQVGIRDVDQAIAKIQAEAQRSAEITKASREVKAAKVPANGRRSAKGGIPATGANFWLGFLDQEGRGLADVFEAALATLKKEHKFNPTPDQRRMLRNRLVVTFHGAAQDKAILSTGSGRDRLYRLPKRRQSLMD